MGLAGQEVRTVLVLHQQLLAGTTTIVRLGLVNVAIADPQILMDVHAARTLIVQVVGAKAQLLQAVLGLAEPRDLLERRLTKQHQAFGITIPAQMVLVIVDTVLGVGEMPMDFHAVRILIATVNGVKEQSPLCVV